MTNLDSSLLQTHEVHKLLPKVYRKIGENADKLLFVKVHDTFIHNRNDEPIIPLDTTHRIIYFIRNPLDIVSSFANHNAYSLKRTIKLMNNPQGTLALQEDGLQTNNQFPQLMFDWSGHVRSWTKNKRLNALVIRYEDMLQDGLTTFQKILKSIGLEATDEQVQTALDLCRFDKLQQNEQRSGFLEKNVDSNSFFRKGKAGAWQEELNPEQVQSIIEQHAKTMEIYGYLPQ